MALGTLSLQKMLDLKIHNNFRIHNNFQPILKHNQQQARYIKNHEKQEMDPKNQYPKHKKYYMSL